MDKQTLLPALRPQPDFTEIRQADILNFMTVRIIFNPVRSNYRLEKLFANNPGEGARAGRHHGLAWLSIHPCIPDIIIPTQRKRLIQLHEFQRDPCSNAPRKKEAGLQTLEPMVRPCLPRYALASEKKWSPSTSA